MKNAKTSPEKQRATASPTRPTNPPTAQRDEWRAQTLARIRAIIKLADPDVVEEVKWRKPSNPAGVPVWSHGGIICTGETYKNAVKLTFLKGAALPDRPGCSTPASKATLAAPSISMKGRRLTRMRFKPLSAPPSR